MLVPDETQHFKFGCPDKEGDCTSKIKQFCAGGDLCD